jgi:hypothetical protein
MSAELRRTEKALERAIEKEQAAREARDAAVVAAARQGWTDRRIAEELNEAAGHSVFSQQAVNRLTRNAPGVERRPGRKRSS